MSTQRFTYNFLSKFKNKVVICRFNINSVESVFMAGNLNLITSSLSSDASTFYISLEPLDLDNMPKEKKEGIKNVIGQLAPVTMYFSPVDLVYFSELPLD